MCGVGCAVRFYGFQFHKGTIRTQPTRVKPCRPTNFNSIKVQLELDSEDAFQNLKKFQFHKGTIRTHYEEGFPHTTYISIP